jgi:hypothetical protein
MLFKTILLVFLISVSLPQHDSLAVKSLYFFSICFFCIVLLLVGIVDKLVPQEVQKVFVATEDSTEDVSEKEEHGTFDFFGRDILRKTSRKLGELKEAIKITFSRDTQGLDCNETLSEGTLDKFKSRIKAIYPGRNIILPWL